MVVEPGAVLSSVRVLETEMTLVLPRSYREGGDDLVTDEYDEVDGYKLMRMHRQEQGNGLAIKEGFGEEAFRLPWMRSLGIAEKTGMALIPTG